MELILNRVKYACNFNDVKIILSADLNALTFTRKWSSFRKLFHDNDQLLKWALQNQINDTTIISYSFGEHSDSNLTLPLIPKLYDKCVRFFIGQSLINQGWIVNFEPKGVNLTAYNKLSDYKDDWGVFQKIDFVIDHKLNSHIGEITFNISSLNTLISNSEIEVAENFGNLKTINASNCVKRTKNSSSSKARIIANNTLIKALSYSFEKAPINFKKRYKDLLWIYNSYLKDTNVNNLTFLSSGFDSLPANKVSFERNRMIFKNGSTDINPISGMRNHGVYKEAPHAEDVKFIFIFQYNDDANALYKYLKTGFKGFPGLERYVGIPVVLADSGIQGQLYKRLQFESLNSLMSAFRNFEELELPESYYENYFALVIGPFRKDEPQKEYYTLKLALLSKGIPSQFINHHNIRKASIFNYHLPNIAIGIHAKLGGVPWRIDSDKKKQLVIGFNQDFNSERKRFVAGSVFFDNHGNLRRTFSFPEQESSIAIIHELRNAVNSFLQENGEIDRIIIHYHKTLSKEEKGSIDKLLKQEFAITVPYAVVEINDTKTRLELAFDPNYDFGIPVSGSFIRLSTKEYLLFNNNRFKDISPVVVKDELPLKIKIHFADESGFSHKELIEQVYEFSRLIWKGLKQRSQPATCYYAREIARFQSNTNLPIPENKLTQTTPWVI